jgi:drug/metabolite transporter (DMT)-like permease
MNTKRTRAYLALLLVAIIWGAALPVIKLALPYTTPYRWLFYRYLVAAPLASPFIIYYLKRAKIRILDIVKIVIMELIGTTLILSLLYEGLARTSGIDASIIGSMSPVFITLGGIMFLKEREEKKEWIGLFLAIAGTLIITIEPLITKSLERSQTGVIGNALVLSQNIIWAIYLVIVKKLYKKIPKFFVSAISFWVGLISFLILARVSSSLPLFADLTVPIVAISTVYMGTLGSIVALSLYLYGQNLIEASEASLFTYLQPAVAIPLSIWLLADRLSAATLVGLLIIIAGVIIAERRR